MTCSVFLIGTMQYAADRSKPEQSKSFFDNKFGGCDLVLDPQLSEQIKTRQISYSTFERIMNNIMHNSGIWLPKDFLKHQVNYQEMHLEYEPEAQKIFSTWYLYSNNGAVIMRCACASYRSGSWKIDFIK